jgi:inner membrane protein
MRSRFSSTQRSVSFKVLFIGLLVLLLLIPVGMIRAVIHDRDATSASAAQDIKRSWGGEQQIAAPVLVLPFERSEAGQYGLQVQRHRRLYVLPDSLRIEVNLRPEMRYRGIHKVPIYSSTLRFSGTFAAPADAIRKVDGAKVDWEKLYIAVGVSDPRAISKSPQIDIGGRTSGFVAGGQHIGGLPLQITAPTPNLFDDGATEALSFEFELNLNGTNSLQFVPLGDTTEVIVSSSWPSPSFNGAYLPASRDVSADGFSARWDVSSIGRSIPPFWIEGSSVNIETEQSAFGVDLFVPVGLYQLTLRATRYAVLFIGLTFVAYFLFEVMLGLQLHLLQYLLIGFANSLFYLLLLSLAEHVGFGWAYIGSSTASSALIVGYSVSVLQLRRRAALMALVLLCLYSFLYVTLKEESYALLTGSAGLWIVLAIIMFLTRHIDWHGLTGRYKPDPQVESR